LRAVDTGARASYVSASEIEMTPPFKPVLLVIRDGWGINPRPEQDSFNATHLAKKPCDDMLHAKYPVALVKASGLDVGLPDGVMGNSEVGHENIGAGRVVNQELVRINKLFSDQLLASNEVWRGVVGRVKSRASRLHLMGIVSDAGVHGMLEHLYGILAQAKADGIAAGPRVHPRLHRRPRHSPDERPGLRPPGRRQVPRARHRPDCVRVRPLLGHGPGQPLGAGAEGVRPPDGPKGRGDRARTPPPRSRPTMTTRSARPRAAMNS
jgi:hypothetical protein